MGFIMPSKQLRAVCFFVSRPDHYPQRPRRLVEVAWVQNKTSLNGAIWSNSLFGLCQGTTLPTQSSCYFLPFTTTFLQQGAQQQWLFCTFAATACRITDVFVFVCHRCLQPWRILDLRWLRTGQKHNMKTVSTKKCTSIHVSKWNQCFCCHRFCCWNSSQDVHEQGTKFDVTLDWAFLFSSFVSSNPSETARPNKTAQTSPFYSQTRQGLFNLFIYFGGWGLSPTHSQSR